MALTKKQQAFINEYLIDLNATQAAIRAGYSKRTAGQIGEENLRKPVISEAINKALEERSKKTEISAEYVISTIQETIERCMQSRPVKDKDGNHVLCEMADGTVLPAYTFNPLGALKGCELLGRHLGMFNELKIKGKIEHNHTVSEAIDFNAIRDKAKNAPAVH